MPLFLLFSAFVAGLLASILWIILNGLGLDALIVYAVAGNMMMAALIAQAAWRGMLR